MVSSSHNAGFFSCCSVKLTNIIDHINKSKKIPDCIDSSKQFEWYKKDIKKDITYDYFEKYDNIKNTELHLPIKWHWHSSQYIDYADIEHRSIGPIIKKYFSPSNEINEIINNMEKKYNLKYENICVLFYRGNDKSTEAKKCSYSDYLKFSDEILSRNPNIYFLIQSDETEFIEFMINKYPNNSFYFKDEIRHIKKCKDTVDNVMKSTNYEFSKKYLAITIIMSKCKYVICGSGNCDVWIMLYRGNNKNVIQNSQSGKIWYNTAF